MNSSLLEALEQRQACSKLTEPAPVAETWQHIQQLALNVPDHARLRPWRFLEIRGERRNDLGRLFAEAAAAEKELVQEEIDKYLQQPLRAPLIVTVIVTYQQHPKVPEIEQANSAACAAHNILLAAQAYGYSGIWRTGSMAAKPQLKQGLGLSENEDIIGFLYIGTAGSDKLQARLQINDYWSAW